MGNLASILTSLSSFLFPFSFTSVNQLWSASLAKPRNWSLYGHRRILPEFRRHCVLHCNAVQGSIGYLLGLRLFNFRDWTGFDFVGSLTQRMGRRRVFIVLAIFVCLVGFSSGRELKIRQKHKDMDHLPKYNQTLARIMVEYASAVYMSDLTELFTWTCSRCDDLTAGFEIIELIVDVQHCLQAYVGVAKDLNAIVIAFRGTQENSLQNWISDLFWKQLDLNYPDMPDAMVHHGFYSAYHNTTMRPVIVNAVKRAKDYYGELGIMVTGHSMGGAMAAFCGLDLTVNLGAKNVQVITFGQPRIGNSVFASYYIRLVPHTFRITHDHDIVPHLPPYYTYFPSKTYHHFPREVWLYNIGVGSLVYTVEKVCDETGEDPECSRSVSGNSVVDHLIYFGVALQGDEWRSCGIVMNSGLKAYSKTDETGNFVLSRNPNSSIIKLNTENQGRSNLV